MKIDKTFLHRHHSKAILMLNVYIFLLFLRYLFTSFIEKNCQLGAKLPTKKCYSLQFLVTKFLCKPVLIKSRANGRFEQTDEHFLARPWSII